MKKWILTSLSVFSIGLGIVQAQDNVLTPAEATEGYKLMFDGTLATFKANFVDYVNGDVTNTNLDPKWRVDAENKTITLPSGSTTDIRSTKMYKDFELRWTYRIDGNQGVYYRALPTHDRLWLTGIEYAIADVTNLNKDNPGAAYDLYAPPTPVPYNTFSTQKWNMARIICKGDSVEHWSNGVKVVGFKLHSADFWVQYNSSKWVREGPRTLTNVVPGRQDVGSGYITQGYLGIQGDHSGRWQIKDLKVTETPCFGPIKPDGSVCATTVLGPYEAKSIKVNFSVNRTYRGLAMTFHETAIKNARIVGLDGKIMEQASLSDGGHKAEFSGAFKTGVYFVKLDMASGSVIRKLNML